MLYTEQKLLQTAMADHGVNERDHAERVIYFLREGTKLPPKRWHVRTPWCAAAMSVWLAEAALPSPRRAMARNFLHYGRPLESPHMGCLAVLRRGDAGAHVALYMAHSSRSSSTVFLYGGNQGNACCIKGYDLGELLGWRGLS